MSWGLFLLHIKYKFTSLSCCWNTVMHIVSTIWKIEPFSSQKHDFCCNDQSPLQIRTWLNRVTIKCVGFMWCYEDLQIINLNIIKYALSNLCLKGDYLFESPQDLMQDAFYYHAACNLINYFSNSQILKFLAELICGTPLSVPFIKCCSWLELEEVKVWRLVWSWKIYLVLPQSKLSQIVRSHWRSNFSHFSLLESQVNTFY